MLYQDESYRDNFAQALRFSSTKRYQKCKKCKRIYFKKFH